MVNETFSVVDSLIKHLKCRGCECNSLGQRAHMGYGGCLSPIEDRLAIIDFDQAYATAIDELSRAWKADVKEKVARRLKESDRCA